MSTAVISYHSLKDASNESKSVSKKLNAYADSIERSVYNKLNKYSGDVTENISTAKRNAGMKISALRSQASRYSTYSDNLIGLRDECKSVDRAVRSKVSSLTASFKNAHGIRNSKIENAISYFFTSVGNSTAVGRWLGGVKDTYNKYSNYIKDRIREWYNYEGGKEFIKGALIAILEIAIAVILIITAPGFLAFLGALIMLANGCINLLHEGLALYMAGDDPATARRLSAMNSMQDVLRNGIITDEGNESWINKNVTLSRNLALGIDIVKFVCDAADLFENVGKVLSTGKLWWGAGHHFSLKNFLGNFKFNFLKRFANFTDRVNTLKTVANYLKFTKDLIKGEDSFLKISLDHFVIPCVELFGAAKPGDPVPEFDGMFGDGIKPIKITFERVTIKDIIDIPKDFSKKIIDSNAWNLFTGNQNVVGKISLPSSIDISIPEINLPEFQMPSFDIPEVSVCFAA